MGCGRYRDSDCLYDYPQDSEIYCEGPQGPRGPRGLQGIRGEKGNRGCPGPIGPRGPAGLQGPRGAQGVRGDAGPQGDPGMMGPQGVRGNTGPVGPQGDRGPVGPKGDIGPIGPVGPKGEIGDQGERGYIGEQGPMGLEGPQGNTGPQGVQGERGCQGPQGEQGNTGATGGTGPQGERGSTGPTGAEGSIGPTGVTPIISIGTVDAGENAQVDAKQTKDGVALDFVVPIGPTGPQGNTGPQGLQGVTGETGPTGAQGTTGATGRSPDIAIGDVVSGDTANVIANTTATGITLDFTLPIGATGSTGSTGEQGPTGPTGAEGNIGPTGVTPIIAIGTVDAGENAQVDAKQTKDGVALDFVVPIGPTGPQGNTGPQGLQGVTGETGPTGAQGTTGATGRSPDIAIGDVVSGDTANVIANTTATGITLDFTLPIGATGPTGSTGEQGPTGPIGETGPQGQQGLVGPSPTITIGTVSSGENADVKANPTADGISLDFIVPIGPTGPQGVTGAQGNTGETGSTGLQGSTGPTGPAPAITVTENTPTSYKINFKTDDNEITSPNLKANIDAYNVNLSALNSTYSISIGKLTLIYQNTSTSSLRISIKATDTTVPVLTDMRRSSIYDGAAVESTTFNNTTVSSALVLDDLMYTQSQETHWMKIRQQDPTTKLWSLCEVHTFASMGGARTSISIQWIYTEASFPSP